MTAVGDRVDATAPTVQTWSALGTTAVLCTTQGSAASARSAAERQIAEIDAAASRFDPDSELSGVNRAGGRRVAISERLLEALRLGVRAAAVTDGAVDPTLGARLVDLGYDRDWAQLMHVAADEPLQRDRDAPVAAAHGASWRSIELSDRPPAVRVAAGLKLDLGATAKALAADRGALATQLAAGGGVLLSLGGDIATCGPAPRDGWLVRVTDDHRDTSTAGQTIVVASGGLATSSLVARRWYHDGRPVHHVLDPRSGRPVDPVWRTVSVAAASCAEANIASTAALVLGAGAPAWLAAHHLPARLTAVDGETRVQSGWPE